MSEGLHPSLQEPLDHCETVRRELLGLLAPWAAERWSRRPQEGAWDLAEQVDHLIRSEVGTSKMTRRIIRGDYRETVRPPAARLYDSRLDHYPYGRLEAPAGLVPAGLAWAEAAGQLASVHQRFVEELRLFAGPDADALAAPDPATEVWFTLGGWVRLQALHEAHHIQQIRALLG